MRHKKRGRTLGRSSSHRKAMMRNLACGLLLTERDPDYYDGLKQSDGKTSVNPPRFPGRIVTTLHKAKEVRPLVEKCVTIAKSALPHQEAAEEFATNEDRNTDAWHQWRKSDDYSKWNAAIAPAVAARRRAFAILRDKEAVEILFEEIAPRFADRPGGYTRIMRLAKPRLGDAGVQAILEFVGKNDRVKQVSEKPAFDSDLDEQDAVAEEPEQEVVEDETTDEAADDAVAQSDDAAADDESNDGGEDEKS